MRHIREERVSVNGHTKSKLILLLWPTNTGTYVWQASIKRKKSRKQLWLKCTMCIVSLGLKKVRKVRWALSTHEDTSFHICCWRRDRHFYVIIRATLWSSRWHGNGITFFLSIFKNLSIVSATTIVPAISHSATQPSTDWANPPNSITSGLYPSKSWWKTAERFKCRQYLWVT